MKPLKQMILEKNAERKPLSDLIEERAEFNKRSDNIRNPKSRQKREEELKELEEEIENGNYDYKHRTRLYRLRKAVREPTMRQRLFGFKPGRLRKKDEEFLRVMEKLEDIKKEIEEAVDGKIDAR